MTENKIVEFNGSKILLLADDNLVSHKELEEVDYAIRIAKPSAPIVVGGLSVVKS